MEQGQKSRRRQYSAQFKQQVLSECGQGGASTASVALKHGINANLIHKWRRGMDCGALSPVGKASAHNESFIALPMPVAPIAAQDIRIELRRGATTLSVSWPSQTGGECAQWLRELMK